MAKKVPRKIFKNFEYRLRQVLSMKALNCNVVELFDFEEYCVHFQAGGHTMVLMIYLDDDYPEKPPRIYSSPPVHHKWVNASNGEIKNAPCLKNYGKHMLLGAIVMALVQEFTRSAPKHVKQQPPKQQKKQPKQQQRQSKKQPVGGAGDAATTTNTAASAGAAVWAGVGAAASGRSSSSESVRSSSSESSSSSSSSATSIVSVINVRAAGNAKVIVLQPEPAKEREREREQEQEQALEHELNKFINEISRVVKSLNGKLDSMISQVKTMAIENEAKETDIAELKRTLNEDVAALKELRDKCDTFGTK